MSIKTLKKIKERMEFCHSNFIGSLSCKYIDCSFFTLALNGIIEKLSRSSSIIPLREKVKKENDSLWLGMHFSLIFSQSGITWYHHMYPASQMIRDCLQYDLGNDSVPLALQTDFRLSHIRLVTSTAVLMQLPMQILYLLNYLFSFFIKWTYNEVLWNHNPGRK